MATYFFAIDETGKFNIFSDPQYSFACGVLMTASQSEIIARYKRIFGNNYALSAIHYFPKKDKDQCPNPICEDPTKVAKCIGELVPLAEKVYISDGKPILASNQQHWWVLAVASVIQGLFENYEFKKGDTINIEVDGRADIVWGIIEDENKTKKTPTQDERYEVYKAYHNIIAADFKKKYVDKYIQSYGGIYINFRFSSDSSSHHVNVADIICGLIKDENKPEHGISATKCFCIDVLSNESPMDYIDDNPYIALTLILQRVLSGDRKDVDLLKRVFPRLAKSRESYVQAWEEIDSFMEVNLQKRGQENIMPKLAPLQKYFCDEIKLNRTNTKNEPLLSTKTRTEVIYRLLAFETHNGAIKPYFSKDYCLELLNKGDEQHLIRKWEIYLKNCYNFAQIEFNAYDFGAVEADFKKLWQTQEKFTELPFDFVNEKDDTTAAITGNIGQALAFQGKLEDALFYYAIAEDKVYKRLGRGKTMGYIFTIYHRQRKLDQCHEYFQKQTGKNAINFGNSINEKTDGFLLHSYLRLRALELELNEGVTNLPALPQIDFSLHYPFNLVWKWAAVNRLIEHGTNDKMALSHLTKAVEGSMQGGFTLQTMALPAIQLIHCISPKNVLCQDYTTRVQELREKSEHFKKFVDTQVVEDTIKQPLATLDNGLTLWQRAMLLPSYYA